VRRRRSWYLCASGGHLQEHLLLVFHNRQDRDEMKAGSGNVCFSMGPICITDATGSLGLKEPVAFTVQFGSAVLS
jgi:hypothetical protein